MANKKFKMHVKGDKIKWFITAIVGLALVASTITLAVKLNRQTTTTTIGGEAYSIGTLDAAGKYAKADTAIYLRKSITTKGLKCTLEENAKIKYQIFYYDKDGKFLSASEELMDDFTGTSTNIPAGAKSVKIMITPLEDEDGKVSIMEVLGYANQLKVTVDR